MIVFLKLCDVSEYKYIVMGCFVSLIVFNRIGRLVSMVECIIVYLIVVVIL